MPLKLSIIIPVYNGQKTIVGTLDSIYKVGMAESEFEILVVDDCSVDNTISVLYEYAKIHTNICILRQPTNQKQGMARNRAIPLAKGEYITFVDADDRVEDGMKVALEEAISSGVDLVMCQTRTMKINGEYIDHYLCPEEEIINGREMLNRHYHWHLPGAPWGYLIKAGYLQNNGIRFIPERFHEDADWILKQIYYANTVKVCKDTIYTYVETIGSTVHMENASRYADSVHADYRVLRFAKEQQEEAPEFAKACIEDRTCSIDKKMTRLWKLDDGKYCRFYQGITDEVRVYLVAYMDKSACHKISLLLLKYRDISLSALYMFARPMCLLRKFIRNS